MSIDLALEAQVLIVAISQEGSFLRAAKKLQMPQPSLTRKVANWNGTLA